MPAFGHINAELSRVGRVETRTTRRLSSSQGNPNRRPAVRYNIDMPPLNASRRRQKSPPPGDTGQEALYLRFLSEKQVRVSVKLHDGETVSGWIEYFDDRMIRLTREGKPNLFIYKHQIRTITEQARRGEEVRRRSPRKLPTASGLDTENQQSESFRVDDPPNGDSH
jgi:host factor-I protein